jgi:hypothetical protein
MSRDLPARPNLEHLKNQAKARLRDLQRDDPAARLADALHAVAREYGFRTWPLLKAHIESPAIDIRHPFAGTWTVNVSKSQRSPLNEFRSATLTFDVDGDTVTIRHVSVDASGREERDTNMVRVDGREHVLAHGNGYVARWRGARLLEVEARKDAAVVGRGTYEVSADERTMTVATADQRLVLERVAPTA